MSPRPKFTSGLKTAPWTDQYGNQEGSTKQGDMWVTFHDSLDDNNSNKIHKKQSGLILHSQLFGRPEDRAIHLSTDDLKEDDAVQKIIQCVYRRECLNCRVRCLLRDLHAILNMRWRQHESFENFEGKVLALLSKLNSHGPISKLSDSMAVMLLLENANVDNAQRVSVLASCAKATDASKLTAATSTEDYIEFVTYDKHTSVICQYKCCKTKVPYASNTFNGNSPNNGSEHFNKTFNNNGNNSSRTSRRMAVDKPIAA